MSVEDKVPYVAMSARDRKRYKREMNEWTKTTLPPQKREMNEWTGTPPPPPQKEWSGAPPPAKRRKFNKPKKKQKPQAFTMAAGNETQISVGIHT